MAEPDDGGNLLETGQQQQTTQPESWYSEGDYGELVAQKGWSSANDTLKSYSELEKSMGAKVKIPTPESSAEEVSSFYAKIGRPENPDGYEFTDIPDNVPRDENMESLMRKVAFDSGIPKSAFESQIKAYYDALGQAMEKNVTDAKTALEGEWKDKYGANMEIAKRFMNEGGEDFVAFINDSGLGNNTTLIKAFYNYGLKIMDDSLIKGDGAGGDSTDKNYEPQYPDSPEMYAAGDDEDSKKARSYFRAKGHSFGRQD